MARLKADATESHVAEARVGILVARRGMSRGTPFVSVLREAEWHADRVVQRRPGWAEGLRLRGELRYLRGSAAADGREFDEARRALRLAEEDYVAAERLGRAGGAGLADVRARLKELGDHR